MMMPLRKKKMYGNIIEMILIGGSVFAPLAEVNVNERSQLSERIPQSSLMMAISGTATTSGRLNVKISNTLLQPNALNYSRRSLISLKSSGLVPHRVEPKADWKHPAVKMT